MDNKERETRRAMENGEFRFPEMRGFCVTIKWRRKFNKKRAIDLYHVVNVVAVDSESAVIDAVIQLRRLEKKPVIINIEVE